MARRPNYRHERTERDRSARSRQEEKLAKLQERAAKRKADREAAGLPPETSDEASIESVSEAQAIPVPESETHS